ncbi:MAG: type II toxin-antitoxin system VapC family toxin [Actinomycetota bacterium]|nr:type II toxin-antitoxin system VapC family toxin [Actinomycetota bacterium]
MRFWDANAVVPLLVNESQSYVVGELLRQDADMVAWWVTRSECIHALARKTREGVIDHTGYVRARAILERVSEAWSEVLPAAEVRAEAEVLLEKHPLRTADAYQLAAALDWCGGAPAGARFVCFDERLRQAAETEGFEVLPSSLERKPQVAVRPPDPVPQSDIERKARGFVEENEPLLRQGSATVLGRVFVQGTNIFTAFSEEVIEAANRAASTKNALADAIRNPATPARRLQELEVEEARASEVYEARLVAYQELNDLLERIQALLPEQETGGG